MDGEELFKKFKNRKFETINDLTDEEFDHYYNYFYNKHYRLLRKYFSLFTLQKIKKNGILNPLYKEEPLFMDELEQIPTQFHYSFAEQKISIEFYILMEVIIRKDLKTHGLFRKTAPISLIKKSNAELMNSISEKMNIEAIIKNMMTYDEITLCCLFKHLFDNYPTGPLPVVFMDMYIKLPKVQSKYEKLICYKFLHLNLPRQNRIFIEVVANFFEMLYMISTDCGTDCKDHLDRYGLALVMTPKFFKLENINFPLENIASLSESITFVFTDIPDIFRVSFY